MISNISKCVALGGEVKKSYASFDSNIEKIANKIFSCYKNSSEFNDADFEKITKIKNTIKTAIISGIFLGTLKVVSVVSPAAIMMTLIAMSVFNFQNQLKSGAANLSNFYPPAMFNGMLNQKKTNDSTPLDDPIIVEEFLAGQNTLDGWIEEFDKFLDTQKPKLVGEFSEETVQDLVNGFLTQHSNNDFVDEFLSKERLNGLVKEFQKTWVDGFLDEQAPNNLVAENESNLPNNQTPQVLDKQTNLSSSSRLQNSNNNLQNANNTSTSQVYSSIIDSQNNLSGSWATVYTNQTEQAKNNSISEVYSSIIGSGSWATDYTNQTQSEDNDWVNSFEQGERAEAEKVTQAEAEKAAKAEAEKAAKAEAEKTAKAEAEKAAKAEAKKAAKAEAEKTAKAEAEKAAKAEAKKAAKEEEAKKAKEAITPTMQEILDSLPKSKI